MQLSETNPTLGCYCW